MSIFALWIALPGLLFETLSALPAALGLFAAVRHLRSGRRLEYFQNLYASIAGGALALGLLWSSLFGDSLSRSSTAGLIFAVAPIYAACVQGIVHWICGPLQRKWMTAGPLSFFARLAMLIPLAILTVLMTGLVKTSFEGNDADIAQRSSDPATLQRLYAQSKTGELDPFRIPFNLAQNPEAPPDLLTALAGHANPSVRSRVASNPRTPGHVVAALRNDCAAFVRKAAEERLGPNTPPQEANARTGACALERWK